MKKFVWFLFLSFVAISFAKVYFKEEFNYSDDDSLSKVWVQSNHKYGDVSIGKLILSSGKFYGDEQRDKGLKTSEDARFYGISAKFKSFSNKGKSLVIQYTIKHEQNIDCGGGYLKIFGSDVDQKDFHNESPYKIMFGPDICGSSTKKVHAILNYKDENKLIQKEIRCQDDELTHLYTFVINSDNTYEVYVDEKKVESGELKKDWDLLLPETIPDPNAKKPEDWVDEEFMDDPSDSKPDNWDQPEHIPDADAKKPDDWDDSMDGEWTAPMTDNPDFKGKWKPKKIPNPNFRGKWIAPEISNPDYKPDDELYLFNDISGVGIDIWQVKSGSIFDNILITDSLEEAKEHAKKTFYPLKEKEEELKNLEREKLEEEVKNKNAEEKKAEDENDEDDDDKEASEKNEDHDEL